MSFRERLAVAVLPISLIVPTAFAETVNCTPIASVPYTINAQGVYCLTTDLTTTMTSGNAITINTNNVVLDLNGHKIGGMGGGLGTSANGVFSSQHQNITVKNGTIRGFFTAVWLADLGPGIAQGHVVEDIRADQSTYVGISVAGIGHVVRRNQVIATGGSTFFGPNTDAVGISVPAHAASRPGARVIDNDVLTVTKQGTGTAYGIYFNGVPDSFAANNRITVADVGIAFVNGATGKYRDNLTSGVTTLATGGTDAGNNN